MTACCLSTLFGCHRTCQVGRHQNSVDRQQAVMKAVMEVHTSSDPRCTYRPPSYSCQRRPLMRSAAPLGGTQPVLQGVTVTHCWSHSSPESLTETPTVLRASLSSVTLGLRGSRRKPCHQSQPPREEGPGRPCKQAAHNTGFLVFYPQACCPPTLGLSL